MAVLIGLVVSTPLTLKVFERDIAAQIAVDQGSQAEANVQILQNSAQKQEFDAATAEVERLEKQQRQGIAAGDVTSPEVQEAQARIERLEGQIATQREVVDEANKLYQCERYGDGRDKLKDPSKCSPQSGPNGLAAQYEGDAREQQRTLDALLDDLSTARADLQTAQKSAADNAASLSDQKREEATAALPRATERKTAAEQAYLDLEDKLTSSSSSADGMLSQLRALDNLGKESRTLLFAHLAIALLFMMIELLPVIVKTLTSFGLPSLYEEVERQEREVRIDEVKQARSEARARIEAESRIRRAIEEDMRAHEKDLGLKANRYVAKEMEDVLDVALHKWGNDAKAQLREEAVQSHGKPWPRVPPENYGVHSTRFSIPSGDRL